MNVPTFSSAQLLCFLMLAEIPWFSNPYGDSTVGLYSSVTK